VIRFPVVRSLAEKKWHYLGHQNSSPILGPKYRFPRTGDPQSWLLNFQMQSILDHFGVPNLRKPCTRQTQGYRLPRERRDLCCGRLCSAGMCHHASGKPDRLQIVAWLGMAHGDHLSWGWTCRNHHKSQLFWVWTGTFQTGHIKNNAWLGKRLV
jgi:hypothetical protein